MIHFGRCEEVLRDMPADSFDAVVTDPPYGFRFMGKRWDYDVPSVAQWAEVLRVLKPGGHLLAFGGARTYHRMVVAIEDAGFEVRDQILWLYGSGFPKSLDVSKALDAQAGAAREVIAERVMVDTTKARAGFAGEVFSGDGAGARRVVQITAPHTEDARQWEGWGTALKPAHEPIVVARKSLVGTVAENVTQHGVGALNINGCRIRTGEDLNGGAYIGVERRRKEYASTDNAPGAVTLSRLNRGIGEYQQPLGRWPANVIHDGSDEVVRHFPEEAGAAAPVFRRNGDKFRNAYGAFSGDIDEQGSAFRGDTGSAARFFASFPMEQSCHYPQSSANTAAPSSCLQSILADSVRNAVAIWPHLAGIVSSDCPARSTSVTGNESKAIAECVIAAIASIASGFSRESQHERRTPCDSLAKCAVHHDQTGTTTITVSLSRSDGFADRAIFSITRTNLERGEAASRFKYCAKASRADRDEGLEAFAKRPLLWSSGTQSPGTFQSPNTERAARNNHPTVKPTDLMRYLCRLVTPPGGRILDPFAGSGSTGKGAILEGFDFVGIEADADYIPIAEARIAYARELYRLENAQQSLFA